MRHALFVTLASAAVLFASPTLEAQTIPSPFQHIETSQSLGLRVGYLNIAAGEHDLAPESGPLLGADYSIRFTGPLSGTLGLGLVPTSRTVYERVTVTAEESVLDPVGEANVLLVLGEAGLRFTLTGARSWNGLAPYVGTTAGVMANVLPRPSIEEEIQTAQRVRVGPSFALSLSAGTDWFLSERLSLRLEGKNYIWRSSTPEGLSPTQTAETQWTNNLGITFGAALHF